MPRYAAFGLIVGGGFPSPFCVEVSAANPSEAREKVKKGINTEAQHVADAIGIKKLRNKKKKEKANE